jgi:hypothetical protein
LNGIIEQEMKKLKLTIIASTIAFFCNAMSLDSTKINSKSGVHLFQCNLFNFVYSRNPNPDQPPIFWRYTFEPIIGVGNQNFQIGFKFRYSTDRSLVPVHTIDGYGYGVFGRYFLKPLIGVREYVKNFSYLNTAIANLSIGLASDITNVGLDDNRRMTVVDQQLNNLRLQPFIGTYWRPVRWFQIELIVSGSLYLSEKGMSAEYTPVFNIKPDVHYTFLLWNDNKKW